LLLFVFRKKVHLAFGWLRHGDEGDLLQRRQTLFFIGLSFRTVTPAGPSSLRELARLTVLGDTRSIPKQDPARIHMTLDRNRNPDRPEL
jgi:hypothetical protein